MFKVNSLNSKVNSGSIRAVSVTLKTNLDSISCKIKQENPIMDHDVTNQVTDSEDMFLCFCF